ncbi:hypothetical protein [Methylobacterium tarhaniae]|nr:hypothetical protein [Methylobacterium tarhaniae]
MGRSSFWLASSAAEVAGSRLRLVARCRYGPLEWLVAHPDRLAEGPIRRA